MTELVQIRTTEQLRAFMQVITDSRGEGKQIEDKDLIWFVCVQEAEMLLESYRKKDIAAMFNEGVQAINSLEDVQAHIDNRFDEDAECNEDNNRYLLVAIYRYFGMHDQADELAGEGWSDDDNRC